MTNYVKETDEPPPLAEVERRHIFKVLDYAGGNKMRSARILGITTATLYNKLKAYKAADGANQDARA